MSIIKLLISVSFVFLTSFLLAQDESTDSSATTSETIVEPATASEPTPTPDVETPSESDDGASEDEGSKNFGPVFDGAYINLSAGMNVYFGDIAAYNLFPRFSQFDEHITSAFKFSLGREIKWGFGAQLNYQRGSLIGTRKTGKNSSLISFRNSFYDISLQVNYNLNDALFKKNEYNRFTLYAQVGFGSIWYRSQLFDAETLNTKDYEGYIEVESTQELTQKTLSDKVKKAQSWSVPYGIRLNYKHNYKLDFHLDLTQTSTFTDRLDAFNRSWTSKDKYNYIGIGLTYNFNRSSDDAPKKKPKKDAAKEDKDSTATASNTKVKKKKRKGKKSEEDELLNVRLKLFETQLKLFEMQYLLGK